MISVLIRKLPMAVLLLVLSNLSAREACAQSESRGAVPTAVPEGLRRFALVVGINDGGPERIALHYAGRDAAEFHNVMTSLGGVEAADAQLMQLGDAQSIRASFFEIAKLVRAADALGQHTEFLFFYSGHSDEQGLRLGHSLLPYRELRKLVQTVGADVQVAVLDSCASGTLTRLKGGRRRAPFLLDLSSDVSGHAFLTSASADEAAQESDRIQASFFTHYLVTGLRGAADFNSNGRVTLNEAYRFAFDETLARTQNTQGGVQHPSYDIQLVGTGDLVMTDLKATNAGLQLPKTLAGRFFIRNSTGHLVAELFKPGGRAVELALEAGSYAISVETEAQKLGAVVQLIENNTVALSSDSLRPVTQEETRNRGSIPAKTPVLSAPVTYRHISVAASILSPIDTNEAARQDGAHILNNAQFNLFWGRTDALMGMQLGTGNHVDERATGLQLSLGINSVAGPMRGVQITSGLNVVYGPNKDGYGGRMRGIQIASGANLIRGNMRGAQITSGFNGIEGNLRGVQMAGGANGVVGSLQGVQAAAGFNFVLKELTGLQMSAGLNFARTTRLSSQLAGGANVVVGEFSGVQMAGGLNYAGDLKGVQIAPLNVGGNGQGVQVGVANIMSAGRSYVQIGVLNYADDANAQIGVLSMTRKGGVHPQLWTSPSGEFMFSLRGDANYTYSLVHLGTNIGKNRSWNAGLGIGAKVPVVTEQLYLEMDASAYYIHYKNLPVNKSPQLGQVRLTARYQWHRHLSVFGGTTFSALWSRTPEGATVERPGYGGILARLETGKSTVRLWPGFALGMSF